MQALDLGARLIRRDVEVGWLDRRWPLPSLRQALLIGLTWALLTASFDFGFGHYVDGKPWSELAADYDLSQGRVWILVLVWIAVGPAFERARRLGTDG